MRLFSSSHWLTVVNEASEPKSIGYSDQINITKFTNDTVNIKDRIKDNNTFMTPINIIAKPDRENTKSAAATVTFWCNEATARTKNNNKHRG